MPLFFTLSLFFIRLFTVWYLNPSDQCCHGDTYRPEDSGDLGIAHGPETGYGGGVRRLVTWEIGTELAPRASCGTMGVAMPFTLWLRGINTTP